MITIDIDGENRFDATVNMIISFIDFKSIYPRREIIIHLTKRGYHLIVYGDDGDLETERNLRKIFGDDPARVNIDKMKQEKGLYNFNVLWTIKKRIQSKRG